MKAQRGIAVLIGSLLLASCSATTDPAAQLGLAPTPDAALGSSTLAASAVNDQGSADITSETTIQGGDVVAYTKPTPTVRPQAEDADEDNSLKEALTKQHEAAKQAVVKAPPAPQVEVAGASSDSDDSTAEQMAEADPASDDSGEASKSTFLSAFFAARPPGAAAAAEAVTSDTDSAPKVEKKPQQVATVSRKTKPARGSLAGTPLPGVRENGSLFEISSKTGANSNDLDLYEEEDSSYQVASAAGLARLAPNGLLKQRDSVETACLKPALVGVLKAIERHYGRPVIVTSGYRSPTYNRRVRGARKSLHMACAAADIQIPGVSKWELAKFARSMSGRGGVGTYCHTNSVHVDVGSERDWNWRCRRRKK